MKELEEFQESRIYLGFYQDLPLPIHLKGIKYVVMNIDTGGLVVYTNYTKAVEIGDILIYMLQRYEVLGLL